MQNHNETRWRNDALVSSGATPDDIERFCYGECHVFAVALHRLTGWDVEAILDEGEPYWIDEDDPDNMVPTVVHVFCVDEAGNSWDVRGVRPRESVFEEMMQWHPFASYGSDNGMDDYALQMYVENSEDSSGVDRPLSEYSEADIEAAIEIVRRVLQDVPGYREKCLAPSV